jgi:predicted phosphoribosyltransferase
MQLPFADRADAGRQLARALIEFANRPDVVVLGLPRGGVPVAYEVARQLNLPLDVFLVRKLGVPGHEELAMGAVASGGTRILNREIIDNLGISAQAIEDETRQELRLIARREDDYRGELPPLRVNGSTVLLVDDGLATGSTMLAAVEALRQREPAFILAAAPVGSQEACRLVGQRADEVVCGATPTHFFAVGQWYHDFGETSDDEVRVLLRRSRERAGAWVPPPHAHPSP